MARESKENLKKRTAKITRILKKQFPEISTALNWSDPIQLLVSTILSAQCTDVRVNIVTKELFKKYKTAEDFAAASQEELEQQVRTTGFFRNKAKNIRGACERLIEHYDSKVPDNMEDLLTLPGVARKTANVVLGDAFDKREGVVVDTHVARLSGRLKLTRHTKAQANKIEQDLMAIVPHKDWTIFAHLLIFHGRQTCSARKPKCADCAINELCPSAFKV